MKAIKEFSDTTYSEIVVKSFKDKINEFSDVLYRANYNINDINYKTAPIYGVNKIYMYDEMFVSMVIMVFDEFKYPFVYIFKNDENKTITKYTPNNNEKNSGFGKTTYKPSKIILGIDSNPSHRLPMRLLNIPEKFSEKELFDFKHKLPTKDPLAKVNEIMSFKEFIENELLTEGRIGYDAINNFKNLGFNGKSGIKFANFISKCRGNIPYIYFMGLSTYKKYSTWNIQMYTPSNTSKPIQPVTDKLTLRTRIIINNSPHLKATDLDVQKEDKKFITNGDIFPPLFVSLKFKELPHPIVFMDSRRFSNMGGINGILCWMTEEDKIKLFPDYKKSKQEAETLGLGGLLAKSTAIGAVTSMFINDMKTLYKATKKTGENMPNVVKDVITNTKEKINKTKFPFKFNTKKGNLNYSTLTLEDEPSVGAMFTYLPCDAFAYDSKNDNYEENKNIKSSTNSFIHAIDEKIYMNKKNYINTIPNKDVTYATIMDQSEFLKEIIDTPNLTAGTTIKDTSGVGEHIFYHISVNTILENI